MEPTASTFKYIDIVMEARSFPSLRTGNHRESIWKRSPQPVGKGKIFAFNSEGMSLGEITCSVYCNYATLFRVSKDARETMEQLSGLERAKLVLRLYIGSYERYVRETKAQQSSEKTSQYSFPCPDSPADTERSRLYLLKEGFPRFKAFTAAHLKTCLVR